MLYLANILAGRFLLMMTGVVTLVVIMFTLRKVMLSISTTGSSMRLGFKSS